MRYISNTPNDVQAMLDKIGVKEVEELFSSIPSSIRLNKSTGLPSQRSEMELVRYFSDLASQNLASPSKGWSSFLGAGAYEHFIPSSVDALASRGEFVTSYTPYQPEISQGTLQAVYEFQSMISALYGMEIANASMYDGASATAEAVLMALRIQRKKNKVLISKGVHPDYIAVVKSYLRFTEFTYAEVDLDEHGRTKLDQFDGDTACLLVGQPNFFGVIEDLEGISKACKEHESLLVSCSSESLAFGLLKAPGDCGVDIAAGEGQSMGNPLSFGGPYVGLLATKQEYIRQLPGRLVGKTKDLDGQPGYVLTLAAREQHIRRDKAKSNICTNHSLCALRTCIFMALLGKSGLQELAKDNAQRAQWLRKQLLDLPGVKLAYQGPSFNEFTLRLPVSSESFLDQMKQEKILAGIPLSRWWHDNTNDLLVNVTETKSAADLEKYYKIAKGVLS